MKPSQTPYRTVDEAPTADNEVEQFRVQLGRTHRWAQGLRRAHRTWGLVGAFLERWMNRIRWVVDPAEAVTFQAIDSLSERRSKAWQASGDATPVAQLCESQGRKEGRSEGKQPRSSAPPGGKGLADEFRLSVHGRSRAHRQRKKNATSNLVATAGGEGRTER